MEFAGILPEDASDPRLGLLAQVRAAPMRVWGLVTQSATAGHVDVGVESGWSTPVGQPDELTQVTVTLGYPLWRNPSDHADPVNLAPLDNATRAALDDVPPWPRPAWLVEAVERMRYARLPEAVRTAWNRDASEHTTLEHQLIAHVKYMLVNHFAAELGIEHGPDAWEDPGVRIPSTAINTTVTVRVGGAEVPAAEIDTDPLVYAVGFAPSPEVVVTAVVPRAELALLDLAFEPWEPPSA